MKLLLFLLILILFLPIAFAETKIFSGNVITDTDKVIDNGIFRFTYDENSKKAFVQTPATGLIVDNGACKSNAIFRVCINRANFSHKNITTYVFYYELNVDIYKLTGSLSAITKSTLNTLIQGESTELSITITNPTDFDILNIVFNYDLTPFYIQEVKGCELNERQLLWNGSLKPKYDKTCTATIVAEKEGSYSLTGNISYFNGYETEKKKTDSITIKILPKQLKVSYIIDKDIEIKKPFYINISLQNIHASEDIETFVTINLPNHISLIKDKPAFIKDGRTLKHSLTLKPGNIANYSLYLEASSEGQEPISYKYAYKIKGISDVIENNTFIFKSSQTVSIPTEQKQESASATTNISTTQAAKDSQEIDENKTATAEPEPSNKTTEQVTIIEYNLKSKFFNKKILLFIAAFATFLIIFFIINRIRKRKKESSKLVEGIKEKLETSTNEQNK